MDKKGATPHPTLHPVAAMLCRRPCSQQQQCRLVMKWGSWSRKTYKWRPPKDIVALHYAFTKSGDKLQTSTILV